MEITELSDDVNVNIETLAKGIIATSGDANFEKTFPAPTIIGYLKPIINQFCILLDSRWAEKNECIRLVSEMEVNLGCPLSFSQANLDACFSIARQICEGKKRGKLLRPIEITEALSKFYDEGFEQGFEFSDWRSFSKHYRPAKRELTTVTGIPGSGKSEFMDAVMMMLAIEKDMKFAVFSPENFPHEIHVEKMLSKLIGKPFHKGSHERMTKEEIAIGLNWINEHFIFLSPHEDDLSLESVLSLSKNAIEEFKIDGVLVDPWNEVEHNRPESQSETEYVGTSLMRCRRFARQHNIFFWIVAHPAKMQMDKKTKEILPPRPYDISGSAHWYNKSDNCLTVHRYQSNKVSVFINKIKFKIRGQTGKVDFVYDRITGRYTEDRDSRSSGFDD